MPMFMWGVVSRIDISKAGLVWLIMIAVLC